MCYSRVEYGANIALHRNKQLAWKNLAYLRDEYGSIQICKFIQLFLPKNLFSNISSLYVVCNIFQVNCVFTSLNTIKIKTSIKASVAERKLFNFSPGPSFVPCFGLHPGSDSGCSGQKKTFIFKYLFVDIWYLADLFAGGELLKPSWVSTSVSWLSTFSEQSSSPGTWPQ